MGVGEPRRSFSQHRHAERRRIRRRQEFFVSTLVSGQTESFSVEEAGSFLFGSLIEAKRAARAAGQRDIVLGTKKNWLSKSIPDPCSELRPVPRPRRVMSRLNRSSIFPPLVSEKVEIHAMSLSELIPFLERCRDGTPAHRILDLLAVTCGFDWELCSKILLYRQLIVTPIDHDDLVATRRAREFWDRYAEGRHRYGVLATAGIVPQFKGNWAFFEHSELGALLPGMIIPVRLDRACYLTNWLSNQDPASLDVYAARRCEPLFQHPFFECFNPLFFGKPPSERKPSR